MAEASTPCKPFVIRYNRTTIDGGYGKEHAIETRAIDNLDFMEITHESRGLARCMGLDMSLSRPWATVDFIAYLIKARDDQVDEVIKTHQCSDDPMASEEVGDVVIKKRTAGFQQAQVAEVIEVKVPGFTTTSGEIVEARTIKMVSSARRNKSCELEVSTDVLQWLIKAVWHKWSADRDHECAGKIDRELPNLDSEHCQWKKRNGYYRIECKYTDATGKIKYHGRKIDAAFMEEPDLLASAAAKIEKDLVQWRLDNHVESAGDGSQSCTHESTSMVESPSPAPKENPSPSPPTAKRSRVIDMLHR